MGALSAIFLTGSLAAVVAGQTTEGVPLNQTGDHYISTKSRKFVIPVHFAPGSSEHMTSAKVFVSMNEGESWRLVDSVVPTPSNSKLEFFAVSDGRYWFAMQTYHKDGTRLPRRESDLKAEMKILVDTEGKLASGLNQTTSNKMSYDELDQEVRALRQTVERLERRIAEMEKRSEPNSRRPQR